MQDKHKDGLQSAGSPFPVPSTVNSIYGYDVFGYSLLLFLVFLHLSFTDFCIFFHLSIGSSVAGYL